MNPMPRPPRTRTIGYGIETRSAMRTSTSAAATRAITVSMSFTRRAYDRPLSDAAPPPPPLRRGPRRRPGASGAGAGHVRGLSVPLLGGPLPDPPRDPRSEGGQADVPLPPLPD